MEYLNLITSLNPQNRGLSQSCETHAIVKERFKDTKVKIKNSGKRFLGSVIGAIYIQETVRW